MTCAGRSPAGKGRSAGGSIWTILSSMISGTYKGHFRDLSSAEVLFVFLRDPCRFSCASSSIQSSAVGWKLRSPRIATKSWASSRSARLPEQHRQVVLTLPRASRVFWNCSEQPQVGQRNGPGSLVRGGMGSPTGPGKLLLDTTPQASWGLTLVSRWSREGEPALRAGAVGSFQLREQFN